MMRRPALALLAAAVLTACGTDAAPAESSTGTGGSSERLDGEVVVFAAASLTDALTAIADEVESAHPELEVLLNFAGSQQLTGQILEGAPADVFASANTTHMATVSDAGLVADEPFVLITNTLAIAVEPGNPRGINGLADLGRNDLTVVLAAPEVPAGRYAAEALDAAGVTVTPSSLETDVLAVLAKVALGEADAGIVYRSDIVAADDDADEVVIPDVDNIRASYPIAVLAEAPNPAAAAAFVATATSPQGRRILQAHGFTAP